MSEDRNKLNVTASARVVVTLEIGGHGPYGPEWTVESIHRDAARATEGYLRELCAKSQGKLYIVDPCVHVRTSIVQSE